MIAIGKWLKIHELNKNLEFEQYSLQQDMSARLSLSSPDMQLSLI